MNLSIIGCSFRTAPVELREQLAFDEAKLARALTELAARYGAEAVLLGTCNRVELYLARAEQCLPFDADLIAEFLGEIHQVPTQQIRPLLYERHGCEAVMHLFRVAASLDSLIVGEAQIVGQVKQAYEFSLEQGSTGPLLNALFKHALTTAKRVRTETGIAKGHVSVSSVAVDYVRQVFDRFDDKTVLLIGAGKMGRLTLQHLARLEPRAIRVINRSLEKAIELATICQGEAIPWEKLDQGLIEADIVISTTGAKDLIIDAQRYRNIIARRSGDTQVILDIAVPRDFDPDIHDGDRTCLFNIDDLTRIREQTLATRKKHITAAEAIIAQECEKFQADWNRRRNGPVIAQLRQDFDAKRCAITEPLLARLDGKLSDAEKQYIEGAFRLFQNQLLHTPIDALHQSAREGSSSPLLEALRKLFRLQD